MAILVYLLGTFIQLVSVCLVFFLLNRYSVHSDVLTISGIILGGISSALWGIIVANRYFHIHFKKILKDFFNIHTSYKHYLLSFFLIIFDFSFILFGGKMLEDYHAARVLPGYEPDNKIKLLKELKEQVEIVIAINANNIEHSKARGDLGISYDQEVFRLIDKFNTLDIYVGSVVITQYNNQPAADAFRKQLEKNGIASYLHYPIKGYPTDINHIISPEGMGKND